MYIVLGATGRVGSQIVKRLREYDEPVRAVVRDEKKAAALEVSGTETAVADYFDGEALASAFKGADSLFVLTPENPFSEDYLKDIAVIIKNYQDAVSGSDIKKVVGLSSFGAQLGSGTGNLEASYMLEHAFADLDIEQIFVRPTYYYSNWTGYLDLAREAGILPTFFPPDFTLPMVAPEDVGDFVADVLAGKIKTKPVMEIVGPESYSSNDIADEFSKVLGREVHAVETPRNQWESTLEQVGFSPLGAKNLALMTEATVSGKTRAEGEVIKTGMTFAEYIKGFI